MIWAPRLMKVCATAMGLLLYVLIVQAWAQDATQVAPIGEIERWGKVIDRVGFSLVGFGILAYMLYRQTALEDITKRYDATQQAHLQAFKDINEAYRLIVQETKDTILLSVQVQSTLLAKVEAMERNHGK